MGKSYSKQEEKEVIITQNAVGDNGASGIRTDHIQANNILLTIVLALAGVGILFVLYKYYRKCHQNWMRREMRQEFYRRVQLRLSGRRDAEPRASPQVGDAGAVI